MSNYKLKTDHASCGRLHRRSFLADCGMGLTGLALSNLLTQDSRLSANDSSLPNGAPQFAPKVKRVIWLFMLGGTSHMESFDPKPELNRHAGKTFAESPYHKEILESPFYRKNVRDFAGTLRDLMPKIYPKDLF